MNHLYRVYGLTLASNLALPLPLSPGKPDLRVSFLELEQGSRGDGLLEMEEGPVGAGYLWKVLLGQECLFTALLEARTLTVRFSSALGRKAVVEAFLHPLLARVLRVLGVPGLHASVVSFQGEGVALIGESGAGKSTLAKALTELGAQVISDDLAVLLFREGSWQIPTGSSGLRLVEPKEGRKIFTLKSLPQPPLELKSESAPLSESTPVDFRLAVFLEESSGKLEFLQLEEPRQKLLLLLKNRFAASLLSPSHKEEEFSLLSQLAREVPMMKLRRPKQGSLLPQQARFIAQILSRPAKKAQSS